MEFSSLHKRKQAFWDEFAACDHCVHIYDDDPAFIDTLEEFATTGLRQGDAIVLIATPAHLAALEQRLAARGFEVDAARERGQYLAFDAADTMSTFIVDGWPVEALFEEMVNKVLARARSKHRQVRAFGEMVALMWEQGQCGAVVRLEQLWTGMCHRQAFALLCAYPRACLNLRAAGSIAQVFAAHSKVCTA
jgi:hypothetical protein